MGGDEGQVREFEQIVDREMGEGIVVVVVETGNRVKAKKGFVSFIKTP